MKYGKVLKTIFKILITISAIIGGLFGEFPELLKSLALTLLLTHPEYQTGYCKVFIFNWGNDYATDVNLTVLLVHESGMVIEA